MPSGPPPGLGLKVAGLPAKLLVALVIVVGLVAVVWFLRPTPGKESLGSSLWRLVGRAPKGEVAGTAGRQAASAKPPASPPAAQPQAAPTPPVTSPPSPAAATPPRSAREDEAQTRFQLAINFLNRGQKQPARTLLQEIVRKYPGTDAAGQARDLLPQIPEEAATQAAKPAAAEREARTAEPARAPTAARPLDPRAPARSAPATQPPAPKPQPEARKPDSGKPEIPAWLQSSQPAATAVTQDDVRVASASYEQGSLILNVNYLLATSHSKPVFLGAWMRDANVSRRLGYTATQMTPGQGAARIVLPGIPPNVSQLRVVFFEENGQLFFTKDFDLSK